jgi:hypothetical protein
MVEWDMASLGRAAGIWAAAVLGVATLPALAGPDWAKMTKADDFPPFDPALRETTLPPPGQRSFIAYPNKASSRCIGKPTTPLCAVETLLACFVWERPDLCRMVRGNFEDYGKPRYLTRRYRLEYKVVTGFRADQRKWGQVGYVEIVPQGDMRLRYVERDPPFNPQSVALYLLQRACALKAPKECRELPKTNDPEEEKFILFDYLLIPQDGGWKFVWSYTKSLFGMFDYSHPDLIEIGAVVPLDPNSNRGPE